MSTSQEHGRKLLERSWRVEPCRSPHGGESKRALAQGVELLGFEQRHDERRQRARYQLPRASSVVVALQ